jgi:MYXO-CTERM domain-containing protein
VARYSKFMGSLLLVGTLFAVPAFADIAPPDACQEADLDKACENATVDGKMDQPGTCQKSSCTRATPGGSMTYDCFSCKAGGSAKADDANCSTSSAPGHAAWGIAPLLALGWLFSRRRRSAG